MKIFYSQGKIYIETVETCSPYESGTQTPKVCRVLVTRESEAQRMMKSGKWRENKWEWLQNACLMQLPSQPLQVACYPSHVTQTCQEFPIFLLSHRDTLESFRLSHVTSPLKCLLSPTFFFPSSLPVYFLITIPSKRYAGCGTAAVV